MPIPDYFEDARLEALRREHRPTLYPSTSPFRSQVCVVDMAAWPCPTRQWLNTLDRKAQDSSLRRSSPVEADTNTNPFKYRAPTPEEARNMEILSARFQDLWGAAQAYCPESPERGLALRKLQEARMWFNASIVLNRPS